MTATMQIYQTLLVGPDKEYCSHRGTLHAPTIAWPIIKLVFYKLQEEHRWCFSEICPMHTQHPNSSPPPPPTQLLIIEESLALIKATAKPLAAQAGSKTD